jgi:hypothetical protein
MDLNFVAGLEVFHRRKTDYPQYDNALIIDLNGGYGMYFDDFPTSHYRLIICGACATALIKEQPWIGKRVPELAT